MGDASLLLIVYFISIGAAITSTPVELLISCHLFDLSLTYSSRFDALILVLLKITRYKNLGKRIGHSLF
jgi:hypothetical protein